MGAGHGRERLRLRLFPKYSISNPDVVAKPLVNPEAARTNRKVASGTYLACYFFGGLVGVLGQLFDHFGWLACVAGVGAILALGRELAKVAKRAGWKIVEVFEDNGSSGAKGRDKRPGFDRLLKAVTARGIDMVAAWSIDRLGRSMHCRRSAATCTCISRRSTLPR